MPALVVAIRLLSRTSGAIVMLILDSRLRSRSALGGLGRGGDEQGSHRTGDDHELSDLTDRLLLLLLLRLLLVRSCVLRRGNFRTRFLKCPSGMADVLFVAHGWMIFQGENLTLNSQIGSR